MPTWNQIQSQLRNSNNPVVFFDIGVGATVSNSFKHVVTYKCCFEVSANYRCDCLYDSILIIIV